MRSLDSCYTMYLMFCTSFQNIMVFNKCSIGGRSYGDYIDPVIGEVVEPTEVRTSCCRCCRCCVWTAGQGVVCLDGTSGVARSGELSTGWYVRDIGTSARWWCAQNLTWDINTAFGRGSTWILYFALLCYLHYSHYIISTPGYIISVTFMLMIWKWKFYVCF